MIRNNYFYLIKLSLPPAIKNILFRLNLNSHDISLVTGRPEDTEYCSATIVKSPVTARAIRLFRSGFDNPIITMRVIIIVGIIAVI